METSPCSKTFYSVCDTTSCAPARPARTAETSARRSPVLRALLITLSESRWLRQLAERSSPGQRVSSRFVAGTKPEDVLSVARNLNGAGLGVSIDNLGENVTTPEAARQSAALYQQLLSE